MTALEEVFNEQLIEQFAKSGLQIWSFAIIICER
jgi:hypothetical protein